ncbi:hypothetical protein SBA7_1430004 [Candidatus Sulfotelmatobacter sp. SbA7]|nr:hypothetical protein SBA7_1430004 [Candidatus Sulfotelmatobacter sp. SbA7]
MIDAIRRLRNVAPFVRPVAITLKTLLRPDSSDPIRQACKVQSWRSQNQWIVSPSL